MGDNEEKAFKKIKTTKIVNKFDDEFLKEIVEKINDASFFGNYHKGITVGNDDEVMKNVCDKLRNLGYKCKIDKKNHFIIVYCNDIWEFN